VRRDIALLFKGESWINTVVNEFQCRLKGLNRNGEPLSLEEGFEVLAAELAQFDRYERRALSRRNLAIREFDQLV
jgi:hypothetical protein